jgi:hypothetical protein
MPFVGLLSTLYQQRSRSTIDTVTTCKDIFYPHFNTFDTKHHFFYKITPITRVVPDNVLVRISRNESRRESH